MSTLGPSKPGPELFTRPPLAERIWLLRALRGETIGGLLLIFAACLAFTWANSAWGDAYAEFGAITIGPSAVHLNLTLAEWSADGLLAVFFFVVGLELKHEFLHGTLARPSQAAVPICAALGGIAASIAIFTFIALRDGGEGVLRGWAIPMSSDVAFALAILALVGRRIPMALRAFLLTIAVVNDLFAIIVIAIFYSSGLSLPYLAAAIAMFALYALLQRWRVRTPLAYVPIVLIAWTLMHSSGIHATITGVVLAMLTRSTVDPGESESPADRLQRMLLPVSAGLCVPLFAFFAAGVDLRGTSLLAVLGTAAGVGAFLGLFIGQPVGVFGASWLVARFTRASLSPQIGWADVLAVSMLAGIGFTVALLVAGVAYTGSSLESAKVGILCAVVASAVGASMVLLLRNRTSSGRGDPATGESRTH